MAKTTLMLMVIFNIFFNDKEVSALEFTKPSQEELIKKLSPLQYSVTQKSATEKAFENEYWDNEKEGLYVDIVTGEPLFSSVDKYKSGTGWPSFTQPISKNHIVEKSDFSFWGNRTEVRSKIGDSHLGHVFKDGPAPTGLRYCLNSAALRFIPKDKLVENGYGDYVPIFSKTSAADTAAKTTIQITSKEKNGIAIFAGGCFWCMQPPFDKLKQEGVISTRVGYVGGAKVNPTYEEVSSGLSGHREAIEIAFDPQKISFERLLRVFWENIDPYDAQGQFCDKGEQYTSAVFYQNEEQMNVFNTVKKELISSGKLKEPIATVLLPASTFYSAEDYHQSYYEKNPIRYKYYRFSCGRDKRLEAVWGKPKK